MKPIETLLEIAPDTPRIAAAEIAVAAGARVWPCMRSGATFIPVSAEAGPGRGGWSLATRDLVRIRRLFESNPDAYAGFVVATDHGFNRHYVLAPQGMIEIPALVQRVGR